MTKLRGDKVEQLLTRARREVDEGLVPSAQVALAIDGNVEVFETFGDATNETRYAAYSSTKAFVAGAVWVLIGEGKIDIGKRVADHIPEFATNGKDDITVEQVMLHTSGFPHAPMPALEGDTSEGRTKRFAQWKLNWEPGSSYEYHPTSAHWVLAELIERTSGQDYRDFLDDRIRKAAGLPRRLLGLAPDDQDHIATLVNVGEPPSTEEIKALLGIESLPATEVTPEALVSFNDPAVRSVGVPGGGGIMTAADFATYYQALLLNPGTMFDVDVLRDATTNVRSMIPDRWFKTPASRALGVVVAGADGKGSLRGFGKTGSPRIFGHGGAGGQIAWADPDTGLSFGYMTNGLDQHTFRQARRTVALSSIAAECAG
ncbi:MAG TPA: serine hydrolase domain-containing protein [Acidimicrobiales bacterium]|nr:serine hydrolase domain-containing protein [Acidimicrobiales bacterium]